MTYIYSPDPITPDRKVRVFTLSPSFIDGYQGKQPNWGPVGYFTYKRTYSRDLEDGTTEEYWQTCQRVVEGCFNLQKIHCRSMGLEWQEPRAQRSAQDMYERLWAFKWTPPGRGLWMMGTDLIYKKGSAALNNCSFVTTENIHEDFASPFCYLMDMSMLGVGVGGDTRGAEKVRMVPPRVTQDPYIVVDSREGWVNLVRLVLNACAGRGSLPLVIDFINVRRRGELIKGFGGVSSGPNPLNKLVRGLLEILKGEGSEFLFEETPNPRDPKEIGVLRITLRGEWEPYRISSTQIVDIFNYIGKCVVAGGVRRCLPKGTLAHTSEGLVPIEKVKIGAQVMTSKGLSRVTDWVEQGVQPISQVTTQMGIFEATDKHKIAVVSDVAGGYSWKKLHELEPGDRMVFVGRFIEGVPTEFPPYKYARPKGSTTCTDITIPKLDGDTAWLLGLFLGDGYVNDREVSIAVAGDQGDIANQAKSCFQRFGVNVSIQEPREGDQCFKVRVKSKQLAEFLGQFKQPKTTLDVPDIILRGLPEIRAAFVAGLMDADGCAKSRPLVVAASVYPSFLEGVQAVLASLGVPSRFRLHKDKSRVAKGWPPLFHLSVVGEKALAVFHHRVAQHSLKFEETRKTARSQHDYGFPSEMALEGGVTGWKDGRMRWSRSSRQITVARLEELTGQVVSLIPVEVLSINHHVREESTYDISVEAGEFVAQGGYLVHNTAELMLGDADDLAFVNLKSDETLVPLYQRKREVTEELATKRSLLLHHHEDAEEDLKLCGEIDALTQELQEVEKGIEEHPLVDRRWASNNTIFGEVGMDYTEISVRIAENGEPGIMWIENARQFGRMGDAPDGKDYRVMGTNPCSEQSLESWEMCNLVETYPAHHDSLEDFKKTLKMAYLYAKTVTLVPTHDPRANQVMQRNRRIGCSMSGIVQARQKFGHREFLNWCDKGYAHIQDLDRIYSEWLGVPESKKTTSVKPSGTVSLLCGATPGIHYPHSEWYIRRIRVAMTSPLVETARNSGYLVEMDTYADDTAVIEFPVHEKLYTKGKSDVSIWEQVALTAAMQTHWADNQVSVTVTFKKEEAEQIGTILEIYEDKLKSISFLPLSEHGYVQAPYETITEEQFLEMTARITPLDFGGRNTHDISAEDKFCSGETCTLNFAPTHK